MKRKWGKYHLIFFLLTFFFNYIFNFYGFIPEGKLLQYSLFFVVDFVVLVGYFYFNKYLSQYFVRRIDYYIPVNLIVMLLSCALLFPLPYYFYFYQGVDYNFSHVYFLKLFDVAYFTFGSFGFLFLEKWDESSNQKLQLIESLADAELKFLRSQMSPHFLLNALNSIYSLALNYSPDVYPAISELKVIYSFVQHNKRRVSLKAEIDQLQSFIKIQQRRFNKNVEVKDMFNIDQDYQIEPLLLTSFVENAFKHGISMKEQSSISIKLEVTNGNLQYVVTNTDHANKFKDATSGIGLQNLARRLELLYPGKHNLKYFKEDRFFVATLTIQKL